MSNFKTLSSLKRSAVEYTKTHDDNEIATDSSNSDFVRRVFNEDRRVTLKVITHLRIQKNKWLISKKAKLNAVKAFSENTFVKSSRHFKNSTYATLNSLILFNQLITDILKLILMMMTLTMQTENQ